jgi:hypothetical protein
LREKNTDKLIYEKVCLLKSTEFFAPVHELQILNLVMDINEYETKIEAPGLPLAEKHWDAMAITSDDGYTMTIPTEKLFELMTDDPIMTERYIRLTFNNNQV